MLLVAGSMALGACPDDGKRPLGDRCGGDGDCDSGLCVANRCLDPSGDDDGDGVINEVEGSLGSNPFDPDTDRDGVWDGQELTTDLAGVDTDGDSKLDVIESRTADADGDCITDQFDAEDSVVNSDLSPMRGVVCRTAGICAEQAAALGVACPGQTAICVYSEVQGFSDPERTCDGIDENCDGQVDEHFPPGCDFMDYDLDGVVDAIDVCPETPDTEQRDSNRDGIGDACSGLYTMVFSPDPPSALEAGEVFTVSGAIVKTAQADANAPMPRFRGPIDLVTIPDGGLGPQAAPAIDNAFTFPELAFERARTWRVALVSTLGRVESGDIVVSPAAAASFDVEAPRTTVAGEPIALAAIAHDAYGNVADFDGAATLTASDDAADIPPAGSFADGRWDLEGIVLHTAGVTTLTLTSGSISTSVDVVVYVGSAAVLELEAPASARAGETTTVTLTIRDVGGNLLSDFTGVVALTSDDTLSSPPPLVEFDRHDGGTKSFGVVFGELGTRTLRASYRALEAEAKIDVLPGRPYRLRLSPTTPATPGTPVNVHVSVVDVFGHLATAPGDPYLGTVSFAVSGLAPSVPPDLPPPTAFVSADMSERDFTTVWYRRGTWRLEVTGTDLAVPTATVEVYISASPPTALELTLPADARAGVPVPLTVAIRDATGTLVSDFGGIVRLTHTDPRSNVPSSLIIAPEHAGSRTIDVYFGTPGEHTVTATFMALGDSADITVRPGPPHAVRLVAPDPAVLGQPEPLVVTIVDAVGNLATDPSDAYTGTATFDVVGVQPSPPPDLPPPHTFSAADQAQFSGDSVWHQVGTFTVRVTAPGLAVPTASDTVRVVPAIGIRVTLPATVKAGVPVDVVIAALANRDTVATAFVGEISLRVNDNRSDLPSSIVLTAADQGQTTLSVTFGTVGTRTVRATASGGISGQASTLVRPGAAAQIELAFDDPPATTGVAETVNVRITDRYGQLADDPEDPFVGTVSFAVVGTQPEVPPTLPGPTTFTAADHAEKDLDTTWHRVGTYVLGASSPGLDTGTATIEVVGQDAATIELGLPAQATAGDTVQLTITVRDAQGQVATGFVGTLALSDDDNAGGPPASVELGPGDAGQTTLSVVFGRSGLRTVTATWKDVVGKASINILAGAPSGITIFSDDFALTGETLLVHLTVFDAFGNIADNPALPFTGTVNLTPIGPEPRPPSFLPFIAPGVPSSVTFTAADAGYLRLRTVWYRPGNWRLTMSTTAISMLNTQTAFVIEVGPATRFDIEAPEVFVAGSNPDALVRATDAWRNTAPSYDGTAIMGGFEDLEGMEVEIVDGVGSPLVPLTMTVAGSYTITASNDELYGERTFVVIHGEPFRIVVEGPNVVLEDQNLTLAVSTADEFFNFVPEFVGAIDVDVSGATDYSPSNGDFEITAGDDGVHQYTVSFGSPSFRIITFTGDADDFTAGAELSTEYAVVVASGLEPVSLAFNRGEGPLYVNEPYSEGFAVGLFDSSGDPTIFIEDDVPIIVSLDEQYPEPARLDGNTTLILPAGFHEIVFDDLRVDLDGNHTILAESDPDFFKLEPATTAFLSFFRPPAISGLALVQDPGAGCVEIDYDLDQADGAPVTIRVQQSTGDDVWFPATQAISDDAFWGHFELPASGSFAYAWNASHDLGYIGNATTPVEVTVSARAGFRNVPNPESNATISVEIDAFDPALFCNFDVTALLTAPAWRDPRESSVIDPEWPSPAPVASADINGDGKLDLLRNHGDGQVGIALGRGDGGFATSEMLLGSFDADRSVVAIATGDLDQDGRVDVVVSRETLVADEPSGQLQVFFQTAPLSFSTTGAATWNVGRPSPVAVRDMDGDRLDDIVFARVGPTPAEVELVVAYQEAAAAGTFDVQVIDQDDGFIPTLAVANIDGVRAQDLVFYRFEEESEDHWLCQLRATDARSYVSQGCVDLLENFEVSSPSFPIVRDLQVEPTLGPNPDVTYRIGPFFGTDFYDFKRQTFAGGLGSEESLDMCFSNYLGGGRTFGFFDAFDDTHGDPTPDFAAQCDYYGYDYWIEFLLNDASGETESSSAYGLHTDANSTLIAADFDGDGVDDLASVQGVMRIRPPERQTSQSPEAVFPRLTFSGIQSQTWGMVATDFDEDGSDEIVNTYFSSQTALPEGTPLTVLNFLSHCPYEFFGQCPVSIPSVSACEGDCPSSPWQSFTVRMATGQIDGVGAEELVVTTGAPGAEGRVFIISRDPDTGEMSFEQIGLGRIQGFIPTSVAIGPSISSDPTRSDIAVAGFDDADVLHTLLVHDTGDGSFVTYLDEGVGFEITHAEVFLGELHGSIAGEITVVISQDDNGRGSRGGHLVVFAPEGCSEDGDECLDVATSDTLEPIDSDFVLDGVVAVDDDADGRMELITTQRVSTPGNGTRQILSRIGYPNAQLSFATSRLDDRVFDFTSPCNFFGGFETFDCVEPARLVAGDIAGDGTSGFLVGWARGQVWEAFTANRRLFGATASERSKSGSPEVPQSHRYEILADPDGNGLSDLVLVDAVFEYQLWLLGQELRPFPIFVELR